MLIFFKIRYYNFIYYFLPSRILSGPSASEEKEGVRLGIAGQTAEAQKNNEPLRAPTVKQFYIKAEKGRDFLAPFSHDLACKV